MKFTTHYDCSTATYLLADVISQSIKDVDKPIHVVCIGTDRSTGDSLGPLVGMFLSNKLDNPRVHIHGTLDEPVHAVNLKDKVEELSREDCFVIAVDASLGQYNRIGYISVYDEPLYPGAGVGKDLLPIGDIHIAGIVNISGLMAYNVLQNTRLSLVMKMARVIADSLFLSLEEFSIERDISLMNTK